MNAQRRNGSRLAAGPPVAPSLGAQRRQCLHQPPDLVELLATRPADCNVIVHDTMIGLAQLAVEVAGPLRLDVAVLASWALALEHLAEARGRHPDAFVIVRRRDIGRRIAITTPNAISASDQSCG